MGLTGTLNDGTRIEAIPLCEFEAPGVDCHGEIGSCGEVARYRVRFFGGAVLHACEEHAEQLWEVDEALSQTVEEPSSVGAVDPHAPHSGTPSTRA